MIWNYRVLKTTHLSHSGDTEDCYAIHEVYYTDDGNPEMWSSDPVSPHGETVDELKSDMALMHGAFEKPILVLTKGDDASTLTEQT